MTYVGTFCRYDVTNLASVNSLHGSSNIPTIPRIIPFRMGSRGQTSCFFGIFGPGKVGHLYAWGAIPCFTASQRQGNARREDIHLQSTYPWHRRRTSAFSIRSAHLRTGPAVSRRFQSFFRASTSRVCGPRSSVPRIFSPNLALGIMPGLSHRFFCFTIPQGAWRRRR